jgi:hypothetical protein
MAWKSPYAAELPRRAVVMVAEVRSEYDTRGCGDDRHHRLVASATAGAGGSSYTPLCAVATNPPPDPISRRSDRNGDVRRACVFPTTWKLQSRIHPAGSHVEHAWIEWFDNCLRSSSLLVLDFVFRIKKIGDVSGSNG